jgi:protein phosphatase
MTGRDVIPDIHGCHDELNELLNLLGYAWHLNVTLEGTFARFIHPEGRELRFLGDFGDRGPLSMQTMYLAALICMPGSGHKAARGNHDDKFVRALNGADIKPSRHLQATLASYAALNPGDQQVIRSFMESLPLYNVDYYENHRDLVTVHGALPFELLGTEENKQLKSYCIYGQVAGKQNGFPVRINDWTRSWEGKDKFCVYGHTVVQEPEWTEGTVNIDTGCVFGKKLTALRYPEMQFVSVKAKAEYAPHRL